MPNAVPVTIESWTELLRYQGYLADRPLATALHLAVQLRRPLLLEGAPGVGKTEAGKATAAALNVPLIRLQCYEGLDASQALYEWDYPRQLLHLRVAEAEGHTQGLEAGLYREDFLLERPLLRALRSDGAAVLLIDEIDRADDEFEAFLLEMLSDYQVSIPEIGTVVASRPPVVVLTSNRTRELHEALRRRCLYAWVEHPTLERLEEILRVHVPDLNPELGRQIGEILAALRSMELVKLPAVAEALDWARALVFLGAERVTLDTAETTLSTLVKEHDDLLRVRAGLDQLLNG